MATNAEQDPTPPRHQLTSRELDLLAHGRHDNRALATLRNAEYSRRLLILRLVLHHARDKASVAGPLPPVDEAWTLLVQAEKAAPKRVSRMLAHPHVGVWGAHTLRQLRAKTNDLTPLWQHVGQLHTLASAAALVAGLRFRIAIPLWSGAAVLPSLGSVRLPTGDQWSTAEVVQDATGARVETTTASVVITQVPDKGWTPCRMVHRGREEEELPLHLDDVGPYRGLEPPTPPEPLSASSTRRWEALVTHAWRLLRRDHAAWGQELSAGLVVIVPQPTSFRFRPHSASVGDGFGQAIVAEPHDATQLAMTLVHEFQHSKLNAVNHLVPLVEQDFALNNYSPWRDDPRPIMGLLHGLYAFTAVAEFWLARRTSVAGQEHDLALFELALLRLQIDSALSDLKNSGQLTDDGRHFVERLGERAAALRTVEIPEDVSRGAELVALDHRLGWQVSHLQPDPALVQQVGEAWLRDGPAPVLPDKSQVWPNPHPHRLDVKAVLSRVRIADPAEFAQLRSRLGGSAQAVADADEGDIALVSGSPSEARDLYLKELSRTAERPGAWSGLAIALTSMSTGQGAPVLVRQPELVSAVYRHLATTTSVAPHPEELAQWLDEPN